MTKHVLFICTGNLCRSPLAEGILKKKLAESGIASISVSSAGTFALHGRPAAELAVKVAAERGVDLSDHRSRHITRDILKGSDLVVGMERDHVIEADVVLKDTEGRYCLLSEFGPSSIRGRDIEDPYGAPIGHFHFACEQIEECMEGLLRSLLEK